MDPQYKNEDNIKNIEVDTVTWKTYILQALKQLHGVFGSSIDVDIVEIKGKKAIAKVQKEDALTFTSSITAFITDLSIFGYQHIKAHISYKQIDIRLAKLQ